MSQIQQVCERINDTFVVKCVESPPPFFLTLSLAETFEFVVSCMVAAITYFAAQAAWKASDAARDSNALARSESEQNKKHQFESRFFELLKDHRDLVMSYKAQKWEYPAPQERELVDIMDYDVIQTLAQSIGTHNGEFGVISEYDTKKLYFIFLHYCKTTEYVLSYLDSSDYPALSESLIKLFKAKLSTYEVAVLMKCCISDANELSALKKLIEKHALLESIMVDDINEDEFSKISKDAFGDRYGTLKYYFENELY